MTKISTALVSMIAAFGLTAACGGDDAGSGDEQRACNVDDTCFDSEGGTGAEVIALCDNLDGMLVDGCEGARAGCCQHGGVNQCYYGDADGDALADICASQSGTWTPG